MGAALPKIDNCPECGEALWFYYGPDPSLIQWTFWTDGKDTQELSIAITSGLRKCSLCHRYFCEQDMTPEEFLQSLNMLDLSTRGEPFQTQTETQDAEGEALCPTLAEHYQALTVLRSDLTVRQEVAVRLRVWRRENDAIRSMRAPLNHPLSQTEMHYSLETVASLKRLFDLIDEEDERKRFYRAEIARELGLFDEASDLFDPCKFRTLTRFAVAAQKLAQSENRYVANLAHLLS